MNRSNMTVRSGIQNLLFVMISQGVSLVLGIVKALVLPLTLSIMNFGYWQVYLLYLSYVGILSFGFNDGIYLRYGTYNYKDLPKSLFRTSIRFFVLFQIVLMFICFFLIVQYEPNKDKLYALFWVAINIPVAGLSGVFIYVLQITNQLKKYSFYNVIDKLLVLIVIGILFLLNKNQVNLFIIADSFSRIIVLVILCYSCRDILFGRGASLKLAIPEFVENIRVGIQLMLANLAGMLVLGFGRFVVERFENVSIYGGYSFAISTLNLVLVLISAIGLVLYPTLNRLDSKKFKEYFKNINILTSIFSFVTLLSYYLLVYFIRKFMESYTGILTYLPFIFGILYIQIKMQILINPFYKLLREERSMLKANVAGLILAVTIIIPSYLIFKSVSAIAIGTFIAMGIRLYLSEFFMYRKLNLREYKTIVFEVILITLFFLVSYKFEKITGLILYITILLLYVCTNMKFLSRIIRSILSKGDDR
ncbi:oligosaccharide flippase family protein [Paenibacillus piscarius]|uniref:oligosaccharide flippase family protein n=1 Tax=Paenibacillus piscarius TaxID=1089681 RepID=UPI001EE790B2|nr:oligosaccharide flippase family protein [Paenibacillus piscarius]